MAFYPFDVTTPHVAYVVLGGFVVLFGMFSLLIREKLYVGEAIWAFVFGIIIGPYGGNIFNPRQWGGDNPEVIQEITLEVTRVVLAIGVFAIGVELPNAYMKHHWKSLTFLLGPVMTYGWFVTAGLIYALIPRLNFLSSLVVASCMTPTDPILAAAVVGGKFAEKHVPRHLRHLLTAESGCNDGAAFPFLFIALYLTLEGTPGEAVAKWFWWTWLYEIALGVILGSLIGFGFRHLMKFCEQKDLIDRKSYVAQYVSLAIFSDGVTLLLGSDDLISSFAAGTAFAWDGFFNKQTEDSVFSSVIDLLFNIACFIYLGAWMPFSEFYSEDLTLEPWRLVVLALLVILLRRLPIMIALYRWIPDVKTFREAVFSGHFGPIGVGAIFIACLASEKLPPVVSPAETQVDVLAGSIQPIVAFMVLCSILVHGLSIPFFSLGRRVHSVSRTWSRHQSFSTVPEWQNQTRKVSNPEDIVVNRDDLEHGPITIADKEITEVPGEIISPVAGGTSGSGEKEEEKVEAKDPSENEWQEGKDIVIERTLPGGEVQVQVIPDAAAGHEGHGSRLIKKLIRGPEEMDKGEFEKHLGGMRRSSSDLNSGKGEMKGEEMKDEGQQGHPDSEEENAFENEPGGSRQQTVRSTGPKKTPKPKPAVFIPARRTGRRRNSIRRHVFTGPGVRVTRPNQPDGSSPPSPSESSSSSGEEEEDEDMRDRSPVASDPITPPSQSPATGMTPVASSASIASMGGTRSRPGTQGSMRSRFERVKTEGKRDSSPAKSIRFVDTRSAPGEPRASRSGANTPRGFFTPINRSTEDLPGQFSTTATEKSGITPNTSHSTQPNTSEPPPGSQK